MIKQALFGACILISYQSMYAFTPYKAIVTKPVIDLVGDCMPKNVITSYDTLPYSAASNNAVCKRLHQLLFGEIVEVLDEADQQVKVKVPFLYYLVGESEQKINIFWARKKDLLPLATLPPAVQTALLAPRNQSFVLKNPLFIAALNRTLSVGTTFKVEKILPDKKNVLILAFNPETKKAEKIAVDSSQGVVSTGNLLPKNYRNRLVELLREWSNETQGIIPYVWGGCSFTQRLSDTKFSKITSPDSKGEVYERPQYLHSPKTGFDCSGLILRAAQILNLPYELKNTHTIMKKLDEIESIQSLRAGDIIWIPGHVMVVASLAKNTLIEARSYGHGFGKVQELSLNKIFQNIHSFKELYETIQQKKSVWRLNSENQPVQQITELKFLNLDSLWPNAQHAALKH